MSETAISAMMILSLVIKGLVAPSLILGTGYVFYKKARKAKPHHQRLQEKVRQG